MKFFYFLIFLINVYFTNSDNKDSIFYIIKSTNGHIFTQMRNFKNNFHSDIQKKIEKVIKEYEYRYLSNKEEFVEFLWNKFNYLKNYENDINNIDDEYSENVIQFLKKFIKFYNNLKKKKKKK